jgi:hypothetical protein
MMTSAQFDAVFAIGYLRGQETHNGEFESDGSPNQDTVRIDEVTFAMEKVIKVSPSVNWRPLFALAFRRGWTEAKLNSCKGDLWANDKAKAILRGELVLNLGGK